MPPCSVSSAWYNSSLSCSFFMAGCLSGVESKSGRRLPRCSRFPPVVHIKLTNSAIPGCANSCCAFPCTDVSAPRRSVRTRGRDAGERAQADVAIPTLSVRLPRRARCASAPIGVESPTVSCSSIPVGRRARAAPARHCPEFATDACVVDSRMENCRNGVESFHALGPGPGSHDRHHRARHVCARRLEQLSTRGLDSVNSCPYKDQHGRWAAARIDVPGRRPDRRPRRCGSGASTGPE